MIHLTSIYWKRIHKLSGNLLECRYLFSFFLRSKYQDKGRIFYKSSLFTKPIRLAKRPNLGLKIYVLETFSTLINDRGKREEVNR